MKRKCKTNKDKDVRYHYIAVINRAINRSPKIKIPGGYASFYSERILKDGEWLFFGEKCFKIKMTIYDPYRNIYYLSVATDSNFDHIGEYIVKYNKKHNL